MENTNNVVSARPGANLAHINPGTGALVTQQHVANRVHPDDSVTPIGYDPIPEGAPWAITLAKGVMVTCSDKAKMKPTLSEWAAQYGVTVEPGANVIQRANGSGPRVIKRGQYCRVPDSELATRGGQIREQTYDENGERIRPKLDVETKRRRRVLAAC